MFGEKPWDEAERITKERLDGINLLQEELQEQSTALEIKITGLAEAFNEAASKMTAAQSTPSPPSPAQTPPTEEATDQTEAPKRTSRRKGRIGKELTLDD